MKNGDQFTGEVKSLQNGVLSIDTEYSSSALSVDWTKVKEIKSTATYLITFANGVHVTGQISKIAGTGEQLESITVKSDHQNIQVPSTNIVEMETHKPSFWRQLQGSVDVGVSFTSGNSQATANTDASVGYTTPKWSTNVAIGTSFNDQSGGTKTNRNDVTFSGERFLGRNAYLGGLLDFLHSSQQDLSLRTTLGGGYGRYWKRTGNTDLRWIGGIVYTQESFSTVTQPSDSNAEGLIGVAYHNVAVAWQYSWLGRPN